MNQDRPVGLPVTGWTVPPRPTGETLVGSYVRLDKLDPERHAEPLFAAFEGHEWLWDYMPNGPFRDAAEYRQWADAAAPGTDPMFYVITDLETARIGGVASYLRIAPEAGSIEVGNICFAPRLQRTRAATEAMALMMAWAFENGYRRYEWKCNALNRPSRIAAQRLGFSYEGIFRQALVVKGRNRDTAWFACIDKEWPALRAAFDTWLAQENFDAAGKQKRSLTDLTRPILAMTDPTLG